MKNLSAILLLFGANAISGIAQGISMIAIPWYFTQNDNSNLFAIIYAVITAVSLFWGPLSGTFVDKYDRRHIFMILTTICGLILFGVSGIGFMLGSLPWYLVAAVFLMTFSNYNLHYPNLYAFVQEITEKRLYKRIASFIEIQGQVASVLAGAGAALLLEGIDNGAIEVFGLTLTFGFSIEAWSLHEIFLLDGITYVFAFALISFIRYESLEKRYQETGSLLERFKVGFTFLKANRSLFIFGITSYSVFVFVLVGAFYLIPTYVKAHLASGGNVYAVFEMFYACGAILSGIFIQRVFARLDSVWAIIIMTFITSLLCFMLWGSSSIMLLYIIGVLIGITNSGIRILRVSYLFEHIPNQVYGRAGSIFFLSNVLFRILFLVLFSMSFFQTSNHVIWTFVVMGIFLLISGWVLLREKLKGRV